MYSDETRKKKRFKLHNMIILITPEEELHVKSKHNSASALLKVVCCCTEILLVSRLKETGKNKWFIFGWGGKSNQRLSMRFWDIVTSGDEQVQHYLYQATELSALKIKMGGTNIC